LKSLTVKGKSGLKITRRKRLKILIILIKLYC